MGQEEEMVCPELWDVCNKCHLKFQAGLGRMAQERARSGDRHSLLRRLLQKDSPEAHKAHLHRMLPLTQLHDNRQCFQIYP